MQKEIFFTPEEMQIIRVCITNAPCPYDVGDGAKAVKTQLKYRYVLSGDLKKLSHLTCSLQSWKKATYLLIAERAL